MIKLLTKSFKFVNDSPKISYLASTKHSMKVVLYCDKPKEGNQSLPIHSWFISPQARVVLLVAGAEGEVRDTISQRIEDVLEVIFQIDGLKRLGIPFPRGQRTYQRSFLKIDGLKRLGIPFPRGQRTYQRSFSRQMV